MLWGNTLDSKESNNEFASKDLLKKEKLEHHKWLHVSHQ